MNSGWCHPAWHQPLAAIAPRCAAASNPKVRDISAAASISSGACLRTSDDFKHAAGAEIPRPATTSPSALNTGAARGWPIIRARLEAAFRGRTRDEWAAMLESTDACVTPVLSMTEAPRHPHNVWRNGFSSWEGTPVPAPAPRYTSPSLSGLARSLAEDPRALERVWAERPE
ncbi:hypothetical protein GG851_12260 [Bordetella petrii]|nr:hypothetical protein [Bordetella petrii]